MQKMTYTESRRIGDDVWQATHNIILPMSVRTSKFFGGYPSFTRFKYGQQIHFKHKLHNLIMSYCVRIVWHRTKIRLWLMWRRCSELYELYFYILKLQCVVNIWDRLQRIVVLLGSLIGKQLWKTQSVATYNWFLLFRSVLPTSAGVENQSMCGYFSKSSVFQ
jgi:hypothetical protein